MVIAVSLQILLEETSAWNQTTFIPLPRTCLFKNQHPRSDSSFHLYLVGTHFLVLGLCEECFQLGRLLIFIHQWKYRWSLQKSSDPWLGPQGPVWTPGNPTSMQEAEADIGHGSSECLLSGIPALCCFLPVLANSYFIDFAQRLRHKGKKAIACSVSWPIVSYPFKNQPTLADSMRIYCLMGWWKHTW